MNYNFQKPYSPNQVSFSGKDQSPTLTAKKILNKILSYLQTKRTHTKDLATAYFLLTRSPKQPEIIENITKLLPEQKYQSIKKEIPKYCYSKDSIVVLDIEKSFRENGIQEKRQIIFKHLKASFEFLISK